VVPEGLIPSGDYDRILELVIIYLSLLRADIMAYQLPVFNLQVSIWRSGNPTSNPPDVMTVGNLALGRRISGQHALTSSGAADLGGMWLLLPAGTDIRDNSVAGGPDTVEVGSATQRMYTVNWVDDAGAGFANEHRFAELLRNAGWPVPIPTPVGGSPPVGGNVVMQQNGTNDSFFETATNFGPGQYVCVILLSVPPGTVWSVTSTLAGPLTMTIDVLPTPSISTNDYLLLTCVYSAGGGLEDIAFLTTSPTACTFLFALLGANRATFDTFGSQAQVTSPMITTLASPTTAANDVILAAWGTVRSQSRISPVPPVIELFLVRDTLDDPSFSVTMDLDVGVYLAGPPGTYSTQADCVPDTEFAGVSYVWAFT